MSGYSGTCPASVICPGTDILLAQYDPGLSELPHGSKIADVQLIANISEWALVTGI